MIKMKDFSAEEDAVLYQEIFGLLRIEKHELDVELQQQPEILALAGLRLATLGELRDFFKLKTEAVYGRLSLNLRADHMLQGKKFTESSIESSIITTKEYEVVLSKYNEIKAAYEKWSVLKEAISQRNFMLKALCDLYLANYYTNQSVTADKISQAQLNDLRLRMSIKRETTRKEREEEKKNSQPIDEE